MLLVLVLGPAASGQDCGLFQCRSWKTGTEPCDVQAIDLNADGFVDLDTANKTSHDVSVLLGKRLGEFSGPTSFVTGSHAMSLAAADFDRDGSLEVAVGSIRSYKVGLQLGDGLGGFTGPLALPAGYVPKSVAAQGLTRACDQGAGPEGGAAGFERELARREIVLVGPNRAHA